MKSPAFLIRIFQRLVLLVTALVYLGWIASRLPLTRNTRLDGVIGVLGGLYICSHPAASLVDLLFFGHHAPESQLPAGKLGTWIALNLLVFLLGVLMIATGATRFV
jgi:hypothetical protein